jgi:hypothetical protein
MGKILKKHASRPSQLEQLINEINKKLRVVRSIPPISQNRLLQAVSFQGCPWASETFGEYSFLSQILAGQQ